jgi:hypothetical protein
MKTRKLKTMKTIKNLVLLTLLGLFITSVSYGQEKEITKSFDCKSSTVFSVTNKYGKIDIMDWSNQEIDVKVKIILKDLPAEKAAAAMEHVEIKFTTVADSIAVKTIYHDEFFKIVGKAKHGNNSKFEVNYEIHMPDNIRAHVSNKYGDVFINRLTSASVINVKYGNLKVNELLAKDKVNMSQVNLGYSKGSIENCQWLKLNSKYSKISIGKNKALIIVSKYSKVELGDGSTLICDSQYDKYELSNLENLVAQAQYSAFEVDQIDNKLNLETSYTEVDVDEITSNFEQITVKNRYGSMHLGIDASASYKLKGYAKYTDIKYPDDSKVNVEKKNQELKLNGIVGNDKSTKSTVDIETHYGSVKLR